MFSIQSEKLAKSGQKIPKTDKRGCRGLVFGHFWPLLTIFGTFWAIFVHFGAFLYTARDLLNIDKNQSMT